MELSDKDWTRIRYYPGTRSCSVVGNSLGGFPEDIGQGLASTYISINISVRSFRKMTLKCPITFYLYNRYCREVIAELLVALFLIGSSSVVVHVGDLKIMNKFSPCYLFQDEGIHYGLNAEAIKNVWCEWLSRPD